MSAQNIAVHDVYTTGPLRIPRAFLLRHSWGWMSAALVCADLAGLVAAGLLALVTHSWYSLSFDLDYLRYLPFSLVFIAVFSARGLYPAIGLGAVEEFHRLTITISALFLAAAAFTFLIQAPPIISRYNYLAAWVFAVVIVPLSRAVMRHLCARLVIWGEPVAVVSPLEEAVPTLDFFKRSPRMGLLPAAVFDQRAPRPRSERGLPVLPAAQIEDYCRSRGINTALVISDDLNQLDVIRLRYQDLFERVIIVRPQDQGLNLSSVAVRDFGDVHGLEVRHNLLDGRAQFEKRLLDIFGAGLALLLLLPFLALVSALIYLDSPGRIFYRQKRLGKDGRVFTLLKFRTMRLNADEVLQSYLEKDPAMKREWEQYQKLARDPRITRVGSLLRRFSIDELPQLWNVFRGDMSLVGPRPIMLNQRQIYGEPLAHYTRVTPGITGLWQISGRNHTSFARRAELDVHYVMNWSLWLDIYILTRTVWVVLRHDGAS